MNNRSIKKHEQTCLALLLYSLVLYSQSNYHLLRGGFSSTGGTLETSDVTLLESASGTFATGMSANSGNMLLGGMSITGKTQLFSNAAFQQAEASFALVFGKEQNNYRLVSIPAQLDDPAPAAVLAKLGTYDDKKWRLFDCIDGKSVGVEYPQTRDFLPGVSLFLILKDNPGKIDIGSGYWLGSETFTLPLQKGWNLIGSPYNLEILLNRIALVSSDPTDSLAVWDYQGAWKKEKTKILPWHGYAIAVNGDAQLVFSPFSAPDSTLLKKQQTAQKNTVPVWCVRITATCGQIKDSDNEAGILTSAQIAKDKFDVFKPPVVGDYISVVFPHPEWNTFLTNLAADYRPLFEDGSTWDFTVHSSLSEKAILEFDGVKDVPNQFDVFLMDVASSTKIDLRQIEKHVFATSQSSEGKPFQLIVGTPEYIQKALASDHIPDSFRLLQNYPNPFNPSTTIVFELPQGENVRLRIVNALGQEIAELAHGQRYEAGRHTLVWDARNSAGDKVGSGVYFYEISAGRWTARKKMVLMQ